MRIGILTYHCPPNFGAQLQAISTVGYLKKIGHEPIVLNWYPADLEEMYSHRIPTYQINCHQEFTATAFPLSKKCQTETELIAEIDALRLDAIFVGSDALFKYIPKKNRRHFSKRQLKYVYRNVISCELVENNPFFGGFLHKLAKRIPASVYAASSQNCPFDRMLPLERRHMRMSLANYHLITVRDNWTKIMIEKIMRVKDIQVCPDPVFSFQQNCYLRIPTRQEIVDKYNLNERYILISFRSRRISQDYINSIALEAEKEGLQPVALPMPEELYAAGIEKKIELPLSPIDWYALIIHSHGYIGERMHPIVVCLHNSIPFYCFDEYGNTMNGIYNPSSSKTYLIVSEAGLLANLYSYQGQDPIPTPSNVIGQLLSFDHATCSQFAKQKAAEYNEGMRLIIDSFSNE